MSFNIDTFGDYECIQIANIFIVLILLIILIHKLINKKTHD